MSDWQRLSGGILSTLPAATREVTPRDPDSSDDRELSAMLFAALFASPLFILSACLLYYALFMV